MKRTVFIISAIIAAFAIFSGLLIETRARRELAAAHDFLQKNQMDEAVVHFGRSLSWYVPFGTAETAAEGMFELGDKFYSEGRLDLAEKILSRMRSGLYGARSFYTPRQDLIDKADPILARLLALKKLGPEADPAELGKQAARYEKLFSQPTRPAFRYAAAASGGFYLWVAGVMGFIFRFFGKNSGGIKNSWPWAMIWAAGFALWIWGMTWA